MHGNWQDSISAIRGNIYLDPRKHGLTKVEDYVRRDLEMVAECDLVVAYLEASNPSGIGLSVELGYAKALGKEIFLCCEKFEPKWDFIRALATEEYKEFHNLVDGVSKWRQ